ncbi:intercellular adhesion molecule 3 isoform X2 [Lithobates pipiens]
MELLRTHLCLLFFICGIIHTGWSQKQCEVQVVSTQVFAPFDEWVLLNCTYTCSKPSWESRLQKKNITEGEHWVSTEVLVNDWETSRISCISDDEENVLESIVTVAAYALPSKVTIDLEEELEEGQRHEVTCTVFDVAPLANLKISVIREGNVIRTQTFADDTMTGKQTLSESFYFEPNRRDNLQDFYCQATLELGTAEDYIVQSEKINVKTFAQPDTPLVMVLPRETVKEGESLNLTCRSDGFPEPKYFWIIPSKDRVSFSADKSEIFIRKTTSAHNGTYACEAQNTHGKVRNQVVVRIIGQANGSLNTRPAAILLPSVLAIILALL